MSLSTLKLKWFATLTNKPYWFRTLIIYINCLIIKINYHILKTYKLIWQCARCEDCGRNVHDFIVPDWLWKEVYGNEGGILCYDCFCNRADEIFRFKWRMKFIERWE